MNGDVADVATRRELMVVDQPYRNHNGGQVTIGPDGMLYIGLGDGGSGGDPHGNGQSRSTLLGKILRIDPTPSAGAAYSVPADNPFVGEADVRTEIWMYGLRNPWRFSFDRATGDVWIGDVGQDAWEEIDFVPAADAAGQSTGAGTRSKAPTTSTAGDAPADARDPIFELSHDDGNCSVTGGYVYRGQAIPALHGAYVFADYCVGDLIALVQHDGALAEQALARRAGRRSHVVRRGRRTASCTCCRERDRFSGSTPRRHRVGLSASLHRLLGDAPRDGVWRDADERARDAVEPTGDDDGPVLREAVESGACHFVGVLPEHARHRALLDPGPLLELGAGEAGREHRHGDARALQLLVE